MPDCIDLAKRFGGTYRIAWDASAKSDGKSPWLAEIPCRGGITIYPHGGQRLAVEVDHHRGIAQQLAALPGVELHQNGTHEKTFLFDVADFTLVAAIVQPKRRRKLSQANRAAAAERLARFRYQSTADKRPLETRQTSVEAASRPDGHSHHATPVGKPVAAD